MNCIIGVSSLLEDDEKLDDTYKESVGMIVASGRLLKQVVDDVLDFSKFVSGNAEIDIQRTDLQDTLTNIMRSMALSPITERKKLSLRTFFHPATPQHVETDERRLQQILYNLLSNAVKFSNDKGNVDLNVSIEGENSKSRKLLLQVKDYGKGIESDDFEKIFQPFSQTKVGMKSVDGGTGLGLAITKQLAELLGGSIEVNSEVGKWTTFDVKMPLNGSGVDVESTSAKLRKCCLLLVSDTELEIECMKKACKHFDVEVHVFDSLALVEDYLVASKEKRSLACLVQEDLYDEPMFQRISEKSIATLVTFGPERKVGQCQVHYQSLTQKFPVVLIQEIGVICDNGTLSRKTTPRRTTSAPTAISFECVKILLAEDDKVSLNAFHSFYIAQNRLPMGRPVCR